MYLKDIKKTTEKFKNGIKYICKEACNLQNS